MRLADPAFAAVTRRRDHAIILWLRDSKRRRASCPARALHPNRSTCTAAVTAVESGIVRCLSVAIVLLTAILAGAQSERRFALVAGADRAGNPLLGLQADDFIVENDHVPCDVIEVRSAAYPLAIIVDTSNVARSDFQSLRQAVHHFVNGASRDIAVYTSGEPAVRVQE